MPLYEYECDKCAHRFEKIVKFSDPPIELCPKCGGPVHKLMSSPAIQFKGTGWYITDYAKKDSAAAGKTDKSEKSDTSDGKSEKTDSKKESKSESKSETKSGKSDAPASTKS